MAKILHIESSTLTCSVAIAVDGKTVSLKETHDQSYAHSEKLVVFIDEAIKKAELKPADLDAVCVAKGPGSYTGLRIGVSAAKGLCFGLQIPLISVGSLTSMAHWAHFHYNDKLEDFKLLVPMIDARRMEVYAQQFYADLNPASAVEAVIVDEESFAEELATGKVVFFGDGAEKCTSLLSSNNAVFIPDFHPSARGMITLAESKFRAKEFEDVAYFEPYYLKDFVAGKPKTMF